jgi:hypothetical protein
MYYKAQIQFIHIWRNYSMICKVTKVLKQALAACILFDFIRTYDDVVSKKNYTGSFSSISVIGA